MKNAKFLGVLALAAGLVVGVSSCGEKSVLTIVHFDQTILGDTQKDLGVSIGLRKTDMELKAKVNTSLSSVSTATRNTWMTEALERSTAEIIASDSAITTAPFDSAKETITVGLECNYAPFNWTEVSANNYSWPIEGSSGQFADGYDITIARKIAEDLNCNLKVVKMEWDALIPSLTSNTIDLVIAGMTDTEERRLSIDFTDEYYRSEMVLVVNSSSSYATATSLEDFRGAKIVSQTSTVTDDVIETWVDSFGITHLNAMSSFAVCATAVTSGAADAMTAELPVATSIVNGANR